MISTRTRNGVRIVELDRPAQRNALTRDGLDELRAAVETATASVLYLTGTGEAFCAGADLDTVDGLCGQEARAFARAGQQVGTALETYDGATVAGVHGPARGGGVELALSCDLRVATPAATFAENGVSLGLFGAWGGTRRLPDIVGQGQALDLALSGRVVDASAAREMGLVSRVVEDPRGVAEEVATNDTMALETVKRLIRDQTDREAAHEREAAAFGRLVERRADESRTDP